MKRSMPRLAALAVSLLAHLALGWGLGAEWSGRPAGAAPGAPPTPEPIRFELVETPESAAAEAPPEDPRLVSERTTRSQDLAPEGPVTGRPRVEGEGRSRDLRPLAAAPERALPQSELAPAAPGASGSPAAGGLRLEPAPQPEAELPAARSSSAPRPESAAGAGSPGAPPAATSPADAPRAGKLLPSQAEAEELARAEATGEFSYAATQHFFAEYFLNLKRRVEGAWGLLLTRHFLSLEPSQVVIEFKVLPDGTIGELRIGSGQGGDYFPVVCARAIRDAAPFGPVPYDRIPRLPAHLHGLPLNVQITFTYG